MLKRTMGGEKEKTMNDTPFDGVEINPDTDPAATIIWLHGLGADGNDFVPLVPELDIPDSFPLRFVFPHAPMRSVTINAGMVMRAWYDILALEGPDNIERDHLLDSADALETLIHYELERGMPSERILLAGFSQGGAVALHTGLRYGKKLAGILALSCYLPTGDTLEEERSEVNRGIALMMAHGTMDPLIPVAKSIRTRQELTRLGYRVNWHEYNMQHAVCPEEIRDIRSWLLETLTRPSH
jgi:phospholipase/carboxylesterase